MSRNNGYLVVISEGKVIFLCHYLEMQGSICYTIMHKNVAYNN
jgi:hypothetical protein